MDVKVFLERVARYGVEKVFIDVSPFGAFGLYLVFPTSFVCRVYAFNGRKVEVSGRELLIKLPRWSGSYLSIDFVDRVATYGTESSGFQSIDDLVVFMRRVGVLRRFEEALSCAAKVFEEEMGKLKSVALLIHCNDASFHGLTRACIEALRCVLSMHLYGVYVSRRGVEIAFEDGEEIEVAKRVDLPRPIEKIAISGYLSKVSFSLARGPGTTTMSKRPLDSVTIRGAWSWTWLSATVRRRC